MPLLRFIVISMMETISVEIAQTPLVSKEFGWFPFCDFRERTRHVRNELPIITRLMKQLTICNRFFLLHLKATRRKEQGKGRRVGRNRWLAKPFLDSFLGRRPAGASLSMGLEKSLYEWRPSLPASFWQPRYGKREENLLLTSFSFALPDSSIAATTTTTTTRVPDQAARKIKRRTYTTGEDIYIRI